MRLKKGDLVSYINSASSGVPGGTLGMVIKMGCESFSTHRKNVLVHWQGLNYKAHHLPEYLKKVNKCD